MISPKTQYSTVYFKFLAIHTEDSQTNGERYGYIHKELVMTRAFQDEKQAYTIYETTFI